MISSIKSPVKLYESSDRTIFSGRREGSDYVLVKMIPFNAQQKYHIHLRNEMEFLKNSSDEILPRYLDYKVEGENHFLIMKSIKGVLLKSLIMDNQLKLKDKIKIILNLAELIGAINYKGYILGNINPCGILVNSKDFSTQIIDFGSITKLSDLKCCESPFKELTIGLNYISPEQTGRVTRTIDARSDFYSLGIIFYELMTGQFPFSSNEPMELIYSHIAKEPVSPSRIDSGIPEIISEMILKLMAKDPEERYQSCSGLISDLKRCLQQITENRDPLNFVIGQEDVSNQFKIRKKLYGREQEISLLLSAYENIGNSNCELLLVSGYSGIGKTSLINEIHKPIIRNNGNYINGKFDQVNKQQPYSAISSAFRVFIKNLLSESESELKEWKRELMLALGNNAKVVIDVIPELEYIIGEQPDVPKLGPTENQNRFNHYFQRFIGVFAKQNHPLVLFLDDLQWADQASLELIRNLISNETVSGLLLIGAYRDNEVNEFHPLIMTVKELRNSGKVINDIKLNPLKLEHVQEMISDSLTPNIGSTYELSVLVYKKTEGNPFFVKAFLNSVYEENHIFFYQSKTEDRKSGWTWDIKKISEMSETDNVISLMVHSLNKIGKDSLELIKTAACLGNTFSLRNLSITQNIDETKTFELLTAGIERGLIIAQNESYDLNKSAPEKFKFLHDRVQQAAYSLIADEKKKKQHFKIGNLLLANLGDEELEKNFFDVVNHLNIGKELFTKDQEIAKLAELNLEAGKRAKLSSAYQTAREYFSNGFQLLQDDFWTSHYNLCFELTKELGEAEYLCSNFEESERSYEFALRNANSNVDKSQIYILKIVQFENMAKYNEAVIESRKALKLFGIELPENEEEKIELFNKEVENVNENLKNINVPELINLPDIKDPGMKMCIKILMTTWAPAYIAGDAYLPPLISAKMVNLSISYGNTPESAYGYLVYGVVVGSLFGNYKSGFEFGKVALEVNDKFDDKKHRAKIRHMFSCFINHWRQPLRTCFNYSKDAFRTGIETGDFVYSTYATFHESWYGFLTSKTIGQFKEHYTANIQFLNHIKNYSFVDAQSVILNWGEALAGNTFNPTSLSNSVFDQTEYENKYRKVPFFFTFFTVVSTYLAFHFYEFDNALQYAEQADTVVAALIGTIWDALLCLFHSLTLSSLFSKQREPSKDQLEKLMALNNKMKLWADNSPENFGSWYQIMLAETERAIGDFKQAEKYYKKAISMASDSDFLQFEALSNELYGNFLFDRKNEKKAAEHISRAVFIYTKWGADEKVKLLTTKYSTFIKSHSPNENSIHFISEDIQQTKSMTNTLTPEIRNQDKQFSEIDLNSIIKAAQAISKEIIPAEVSRQLIQIAMTNAGAQKGILILKLNDSFTVQTVCELANDKIEELECTDEESSLLLSSSLINYVIHTNQHVIISELSSDEHFRNEKYFARFSPKSVLCMPINYQGEISGILYLENKLTTNAFSEERIEILEILSSQAAISLTNARLYEEKNKEIFERQRTEKILRSITESTAALTGSDFFQTLVTKLTTTLNVRFAFVTECSDSNKTRVRTLAYAEKDSIIENIEYDLDGTPCKIVMSGKDYYTPKDLEKYYPKEKGVNGYLGVPIYDHRGNSIGHIAVFDSDTFNKGENDLDILRIFAARAGAEIERKIAIEELQNAHDILEKRIEERTIELSNTNKILEDEINERKKVEKSLEKARDEAEAANRAKSEFLANMSHELRTPLNAILGYTQILKRDKTIKESDKKAVDIIHRSGEHLLTLINDVLDLAKIEARKLEIQKNEFELPEFIRHLTDMIKIRTEQKGLYFNFEVAGFLPAVINSDEKRLRQILINILNNAVKFTDNGGITFKIISEEISPDENILIFEIKDTGIGIEKENQKEIFKPFQQFTDKSRKIEGAGLGLTITKNLINLLDGTISVSSELGKGSTFSIKLSVKKLNVPAFSKQTTANDIIGYEGPRKTILVVDDKLENRSFLVNLLYPLGFNILEAANGEEAVDLTFKNKPDMILMDLVMPVMDGFEAARRIREKIEFENTRIIALSASVFEYNKQKSREAGCSDFIPKPINTEKLFESLKNCMKLEWIYSAVIDDKNDVRSTILNEFDDTKLKLPGSNDLQILYDLAAIGDVQGINSLLNKLNEQENNFAGFTSEIEKHLKEFDMSKIKNLIKPLLEQVG